MLGQGGCPRGGGFGGGDNNDSCDRDDHVLWANFKGMIPDGQLSGYFVYTNDQSWNQTIAGGGSVDNDMYTVGARVAGGAGGLSYRFEGYYQFGDADGISSVHPIVAMGGAGAGVSR
ncbi:MAG: hypothetical protein GWN24_15190, partial [Nitrospinaceae bacterium]|nr:hypothetical protein [Nitrospinaceae bacterium]